MRTEDILGIQELGYRFADSANHNWFEKFAELWTDDGVWHIGPPINVHFQGKKQISQAIRQMLSRWDFFIQMPNAPVIDFKSDI